MNRLLPLHRALCWTPDDRATPAHSSVPSFSAARPLCVDRGRYLSRRDFAVASGAVRDWLIGDTDNRDGRGRDAVAGERVDTNAAADSGARAGSAQQIPTRVLISLDDPFDFLCALFGTFAAGCQPVLPAHDAPAYWAALAATNAYDRTLIAEDFAQIVTQARPPMRNAAGASCLPDRPIDPRAVLTLFTSGSTGSPKAIHKTLAQLDAEVQGFAVQWGDTFAEAIFQASVPHHHIYGLTFFLLWPLAAGGVFDRARCTGPGDWSEPQGAGTGRDHGGDALQTARAVSVPSPSLSPSLPSSSVGCSGLARARRVIVSTPSQLARWPGLSAFDTPEALHGGVVFLSAGAPLSHDTARDYLRVFGRAPFEVFGSTETGAIAARQQRADAVSAQWRPLPGQTVWRTAAGTLAVQSPHLRAGLDAAWARDGFVTADAVTFSDADTGPDGVTPFLLGGRIDRVAKVSGKRVSLPEIELALAGHPSVYQAAVVTLTTVTSNVADAAAQARDMPPDWPREALSSGPVRERERIGALIVLREAGNAALFDQGRAVVIRQLRQHLATQLDAAAVPHYWRFVAALPYDSRGKLPAAQLRAAFAPTHTLPEVLSYANSATPDALPRWRYTLRVSASLVQFEGHFPVQPILPGVAQLDWAVRFAQQHVESLARMRSVEQLKFTAPVMPGATLILTLTHDAARKRVVFAFECDGRACATGMLCYVPDATTDVGGGHAPVGAEKATAGRDDAMSSAAPKAGER